jgi:coenzyme F420-0:L-glutamate ligase / coenzyme F420-1:gamma-L-glutamate ligase
MCMPARIRCAQQLQITALPGIPHVEPGDDVSALLLDALTRCALTLEAHDVLVVTSKLFSRAENQFVDLSTLTASERAVQLATASQKDARLVELILQDTERVSRTTPHALIVRNHQGVVSANAGIDASNAQPRHAHAGSGPWVLRLPRDPDGSARRLRVALEAHAHTAPIGVVISDSLGRPFREGTVGAAIGVSGLPPLCDYRGQHDLHGRLLEHTITAPADQLAAVADLVCGQADEARPAVHVRGVKFDASELGATTLCRSPEKDLYL